MVKCHRYEKTKYVLALVFVKDLEVLRLTNSRIFNESREGSFTDPEDSGA